MFKFFPQDYLTKSGGLTLEEQGALMRLIAFCWTGSLQKSTLFDPDGLARLLGGGIKSKKARELAESLHQFFTPSDGNEDEVIPNVSWMELTRTRESMI